MSVSLVAPTRNQDMTAPGNREGLPRSFDPDRPPDMHLLGVKRFAAFGADHHRVEQFSAILVFVQQRAAALVHDVRIAPSSRSTSPPDINPGRAASGRRFEKS
jgi:hypothetical protein